MKSFYSCIDAYLSAPQPEQHLLIREKAKKEGGSIVFYGAEEYRSAAAQSFIIPKLTRTANLDGVVFFTFNQFRYGEALNIKRMFEILDLGLELHFAREDLSFRSRDELNERLDFLLVIDYTKRRDSGDEWEHAVRNTTAGVTARSAVGCEVGQSGATLSH